VNYGLLLRLAMLWARGLKMSPLSNSQHPAILIMSKTLGRVLSFIGIAFLLHSAYSTYERTSSISLQDESSNLPPKAHLLTILPYLDLSYLNAVDKSESGLPIEVRTDGYKG
jgi:hypothetical protein